MITEPPTNRSPFRPKPHAINRPRVNAGVDLILAGLMTGAGLSAYLDTTSHILIATVTLAGAVIHLALHWPWLRATVQRLGQIPAHSRRGLLLGLLLVLSFVPLGASGAIVALIYAPRVSAFHTTAFYLSLGLVLVHLANNWRWIAARLRHRSR